MDWLTAMMYKIIFGRGDRSAKESYRLARHHARAAIYRQTTQPK